MCRSYTDASFIGVATLRDRAGLRPARVVPAGACALSDPHSGPDTTPWLLYATSYSWNQGRCPAHTPGPASRASQRNAGQRHRGVRVSLRAQRQRVSVLQSQYRKLNSSCQLLLLDRRIVALPVLGAVPPQVTSAFGEEPLEIQQRKPSTAPWQLQRRVKCACSGELDVYILGNMSSAHTWSGALGGHLPPNRSCTILGNVFLIPMS